MKIQETIRNIFNRFEISILENRHYERSAFDSISEEIARILVSSAIKENRGWVEGSSFWLSKMARTTRKRVRTRLAHLARYGMIRIEWRKRTDGSGLNEMNAIDINPILLGIVKTSAGMKEIRSFADHYAKIGIERLHDDENDIQGFWNDVKLGTKEPEAKGVSPQATWSSRLMAIMETKDDQKAKRTAENLQWNGLGEEFVASAAKIWTEYQGAAGNGYAAPSWAADLSVIGPTTKRERMELRKIFEIHGGRIASIAWAVYCGGVAERKPDGNLVFDPASPHRQFASIDKRPSQFAKYIDSIIIDPVFKEIEKSSDDHPMIKDVILPTFRHIFYMKPRSQIENENLQNEKEKFEILQIKKQ